MLRFDRPPEPANFATRTAKARSDIEALVADGKNPGDKDFANKWKDYKPHFRDAQHRKCGYCEHDTGVGYHGDLEHHAPKSAVQEIRPGAVEAAVNRRSQAGREEKPLLLHPYEPDFDPAQHLCFSKLGQIAAYAGDLRGWETIRTCRLDRIELTEARRYRASQAYGLASEYLRAVLEERDRDRDRALADLREIGRADRPFAGMVRIIFEHEVGVAWDVMVG